MMAQPAQPPETDICLTRDARFLILALTERCNLHCRYCYMKAGGHGEDMSAETMERAFALLSPDHQALVQLSGGEPCLVPDMIEHAAYLCTSRGRRTMLALQTNATLITPQLTRIIKRHDIQVGISLDGPPDLQDSIRGKATETLKGMKLFEQEGIPFRVTTVVTAENVGHLHTLALLLGGFSCCMGMGLDLLVNRGRARSGRISFPSAEKLRSGTRRLCETLARINSRREHPIALRELDLCRKAGRRGPFCHAASGHSLAVSPDGGLYPCGQTMRDSRFRMGTVFSPGITCISVLQQIRLQSKTCGTCPLDGRCPGECPSRLFYNQESPPLACAMYQGLAGSV